jgi:hypothetical protein
MPRARAGRALNSLAGRMNKHTGPPLSGQLCMFVGGAGGNRTRVRKSSTTSSTCVVDLFKSRCALSRSTGRYASSHLLFSSPTSDPPEHDPMKMTLPPLAGPGPSATRCSGLGLKRPERNARRWRLWFCQWINEEKAPRHALCRFATHVETRSAPVFGCGAVLLRK